jgi:hypothetical protein
MLPKALLMKEWKHTSIIILAIFILFIIQFPIRISLKIEEWKKIESDPFFELNMQFEVFSAFSGSVFAAIALLLVVVLAGIMIGLERSTKRNDFSLALPYSRKTMFLTKWVLGLASILGAFVLNFWIGYFIVKVSKYSYLLNELNLLEMFVAPIMGYFVLFSFAMFIGAIAGDMRSQVILSFIFLVFPMGIIPLLNELWRAHGFGYIEFPEIMLKLFWPSYIMGHGLDAVDLLYPFAFGIIFFVVGMKLFSKAPAEYSGEFLVYHSLHPVFKFGIPICGALLGGLLMSSFIPYGLSGVIQIIAYWIGALIAAFFAWIITKRLLGIQTR